MSKLASQPGPNPQRLFDALTAFQRTAALKAAIELDLFSAIAAGHDTADALAAHLNVAPRGARILADYLVVDGFLTKRHEHYALTPDSALFLDRKSPAYAGSAHEFLTSPFMRSEFDALTDRVRAGGALHTAENTLAPNHEIWIRFARAMTGLSFTPAQTLARHILSDLQPPLPASSGPMKILDIAAGHGMYGIAFALQNPHAHIVAQDWPVVLTVALENAGKFRVADRFLTLSGDAFSVSFGVGYDVVLIPNFLHHFDAATNITLLKKIFAALKPGGAAVTLEFAPNDDRVTPPASAAFALIMLTSTPAGDAYTVAELSTMYSAAGFQHIRATDLPDGIERIISGIRPA